jgi:hypothetical protein
MARTITLKSKAGYTCTVIPQSRSDEMLAKREAFIYGFATANPRHTTHNIENNQHKKTLARTFPSGG